MAAASAQSVLVTGVYLCDKANQAHRNEFEYHSFATRKSAVAELLRARVGYEDVNMADDTEKNRESAVEG